MSGPPRVPHGAPAAAASSILAFATMLVGIANCALPSRFFAGDHSRLSWLIVAGTLVTSWIALRGETLFGVVGRSIGGLAFMWFVAAVIGAAWHLDFGGGVVVGALAGLLVSPVLVATAEARRTRRGDAFHLALGACGTWLLMVGLCGRIACSILYRTRPSSSLLVTLGRWPLQLLPSLVTALLGGALVLAAVLLHARRLGWVRRVYAGRVAGWSVRAIGGADVVPAGLAPLVGSTRSDNAVLEFEDVGGVGPYREAPQRFMMALVDAPPATAMLAPSRQMPYRLLIPAIPLAALVLALIL